MFFYLLAYRKNPKFEQSMLQLMRIPPKEISVSASCMYVYVDVKKIKMCISDTRVFLTVAIDLVIHGIQEPVRFAIETKAKVFAQTERFWYFTRKPHTEMFHVKLKQVSWMLISLNIMILLQKNFLTLPK